MVAFREMERNDIRVLLEKKDFESHTKICDLPEDIIDELADELYCQGRIFKDWKSLASHFGMDEQIDRIAAGNAPSADYSPTHSLFRKIRTSKPDLTLGDLSEVLEKKMARNDVIKILKSF